MYIILYSIIELFLFNGKHFGLGLCSAHVQILGLELSASGSCSAIRNANSRSGFTV